PVAQALACVAFCALLLLSVTAQAQTPENEFFEKKIRPVFAGKCYACHSSKLKSPMGGLALDVPSSVAKEVVAGKPGESRLIQAVHYTDTALKMPPTGKLPDSVIADLEKWVEIGAPAPGATSAPAASRQGIDFEKG